MYVRISPTDRRGGGIESKRQDYFLMQSPKKKLRISITIMIFRYDVPLRSIAQTQLGKSWGGVVVGEGCWADRIGRWIWGG